MPYKRGDCGARRAHRRRPRQNEAFCRSHSLTMSSGCDRPRDHGNSNFCIYGDGEPADPHHRGNDARDAGRCGEQQRRPDACAIDCQLVWCVLGYEQSEDRLGSRRRPRATRRHLRAPPTPGLHWSSWAASADPPHHSSECREGCCNGLPKHIVWARTDVGSIWTRMSAGLPTMRSPSDCSHSRYCRAPLHLTARCETRPRWADACGTRPTPLPPIASRHVAGRRTNGLLEREHLAVAPELQLDHAKVATATAFARHLLRCLRERTGGPAVVRLTETRVSGAPKNVRSATRSTRARGLGSRCAPRSATSDATDALTFSAADPSSDRYSSSSYS